MERQPDAERGAPAHMAVEFNPAVVRADNPLHDHQAQPRALLLGGVKWLEDPVDLLLWYAAAGVRVAPRRRSRRREVIRWGALTT